MVCLLAPLLRCHWPAGRERHVVVEVSLALSGAWPNMTVPNGSEIPAAGAPEAVPDESDSGCLADMNVFPDS
jgi:hypothetical protein